MVLKSVVSTDRSRPLIHETRFKLVNLVAEIALTPDFGYKKSTTEISVTITQKIIVF